MASSKFQELQSLANKATGTSSNKSGKTFDELYKTVQQANDNALNTSSVYDSKSNVTEISGPLASKYSERLSNYYSKPEEERIKRYENSYIDRVKATQAQNDWARKKSEITTTPERDALIEEYKKLQRQSDTIPVTRKRQEVLDQLREIDEKLGNGEMDYTLTDRSTSVITGATKQYASGFMNFLGTGIESLRKLGTKLGGNADEYAGWATDELSAGQIGYTPVDNEYYSDAIAITDKLQAAADKISESASKDLTRAKNGLNTLGQTGVDIAANVLQMGYDAGLGAVTGGGSLASMFVRSAGSGMQDARQSGAGTARQVGFGTVSGGIEVLTEMMFDGVAKIYGAGAADEAVEEVIRRLSKSDFGRSALRWIAGAAGEGFEEVVSDILAPYAETIYNGKTVGETFKGTFDGTYKPSEILYDFIIGAAVGGLGGGVSVLNGEYAAANEVLQNTDMAMQQLVDKGYDNKNAREYAALIAQAMSPEGLPVEDQVKLESRPAAMEVLRGMQPGMDAYVQSIKQAENEARAAEARQQAESNEIGRYMSRTFADADSEAAANKSNATMTYDGQTAQVDFVRDNNQNRIRITTQDGKTKTISVGEALSKDSDLDQNVKHLVAALQALGPNAPAVYSVYEDGQQIDRYAAAMDKAVNLYAANGVDVRSIAKAGKDNIINSLTNVQLEMAQSLGAKLFEQNQTEVKQADAKYKEIRQKAAAAVKAEDVSNTQALTAVNQALREAREYVNGVKDSLNRIVDTLEDMEQAGAKDTDAYRNSLQLANEYATDIENTQKAIENLEQTRKELQAKQPVKRKQGTVSFEGGTIDGKTSKGVDQSKLTRQQKNVVAMVEALADAVNIDYVFFDGDAKGTQGAYVQGGTVYVNINAGMAANKALAAATLSHELTHYMQEFAPAEYQELKQFIISEILKKSPQQFEAMVKHQRELDPKLTYEQATDELIANACQTMLLDSKAIAKLARQNMTLAEKIADAIEDITSKIRAAFEDVSTDNIQYANAVKAIEGVYDQVHEYFDAGLVAATENYNAVQVTGNENAAGEGSVQMMTWDKNERFTQQEINVLRSIRNSHSDLDRVSIFDFTSQDIKKAEKWARKFYSEMGTKSPFFRLWFGEWRANDKTGVKYIDMKNSTVNTNTRAVYNKDMARSAEDSGTPINVGTDFFNDSIHYAKQSKDEKAITKLLANIDDVIANAILLDTQLSDLSSKNKKGSTQFMHILYSPVSYNGAPFLAKITVEEYREDGILRAYNAQRIKMSALPRSHFQQLNQIASAGDSRLQADEIMVSQLYDLVKQYDPDFKQNRGESSKVVDEDGRPLVVYHGTDADFTVFDRTKGRSTMDIQGMFFSPWEEEAAGYGSKVGSYYLNIKKPAPEGLGYKALNKFKGQNEAGIKARQYLESQGYDGVENYDEYIAFNPEQVKSVDRNIGTFDKANQDVQFQRYENPDQISLDDWLNGDVIKRSDLHPDIQRRIDEAAKLETKIKKYFDYVSTDSEYFLTPDEIDDMMSVDPYGGDGDMYNAEQLVMNLSELSKEQTGEKRRQTYLLMDELLPHLSNYEAGNWTEDRWTQNKAFTDWYNKQHPSLYYPGYTPGRMDVDRELKYLQEYLKRTDILESDRQEAQRMYDAIKAPASGTWYQKWDNTTDDLQSEAEGRELAYTRLQAENAALTDTINALKNLTDKKDTTIAKLEKQLHLTKTPEVRESDARKIANALLRQYSSKADKAEIIAELKAIGDYILQTPTNKLDADHVKQIARGIAERIVSESEVEDESGGDTETYKQIVSDIRGKKLTIDKDFAGELDGGFDAFKKKYFGRLTLAQRETGEARDGYMTVGSLYDQLRSVYGEYYFPEPGSEGAKNEGEQLQRIVSMFDLATPVVVNPFSQYMGEAIEDLANRIVADTLDGVMRPETTYADTQKERRQELRDQIKQLQAEGKLNEKEADVLRQTVYDLTMALDKADSRYRSLSESASYRQAQIQAEGKARAAEIKANERAKANERVKAVADYYRDMAARARADREESAGVSKYRRQIEKKTKKLSEWLLKNSDKEHVPEALKAPLLEFLTSIDFSSKRLLAGGSETQADMRFGARLQRLQQLLSNQQSYIDGNGELQEDLGGYVDVSPDMLAYLREMAENVTNAMNRGEEYTINRMSADQLRNLSNLLSSITTAIRNMNNFMANARYESIREAASEDINQMDRYGKAGEKEGSNVSKLLKWKHAIPYYVFKRFGNGGASIFEGLTSGWEKLAFHAKEIIDFTEKLYTDQEVNEWKKQIHQITLEDGSRIQMTTAQIMALSQLLKREQAMKHLEKGGMRIGNITTKRGLKSGVITDVGHYHLTTEDINTILGKLSARQAMVADKLQRYMAEKGAAWGNEISMKRFGYNFYTEGENYFPIATDSNDRAMQDTDAQQNSMFRLLNLSSSKALNPKASNALVVNDIFDVFADHMTDQAKLNALGLPILDAIKWFNFKERIDLEDGSYDTRTLQAAMEKAYGEEAQHYFRTLMKDVNGLTESGDRGTGFLSKMMSNYKIASVAANLRVALLQPTSYVRAQTVISPRNLLRAFAYKNGYEEAMKYSGTAVWKSLGYYDTNISRNMRQQIEHDETRKDKIQEASMKGAELGDSRTWGRLWVACKLQAQQLHPDLKGDALMQATADLFRDVVYSSQVMDSTLTRSELMRGRTIGTKALTAFMAEPTLSYNILLDAYSDYSLDARENGKQGAWQRNSGKIRKAFITYVSSAAVAAVAESIIDAIRDDDDYETFMQKFFQALFGEKNPLDGNLLQDILISGKIPYLKNLANEFMGYSNSDMSTEGLKTAAKAIAIWVETLKLQKGELDKPTKTTYYGNMTTWGKLYKSLQALSQLSGLPASAAARDAIAIWNTTAGNIVSDWKIKTYDAGEKKNIQNAFDNGFISNDEAISLLKDSGMSENDAYYAVREWETGEQSKYTSIKRAAFDGDQTAYGEAFTELTEHGFKEKVVNSTVKSFIKNVYFGNDLSAEEEKIVGDTELTDDQVRKMLTNYAGLTDKEAQETVADWRETRSFIQQHGAEYEEYGLSLAQAKFYYGNAKNSVTIGEYSEQVDEYGLDRVKNYYGTDGWKQTGLTIEQYDYYATRRSQCKGTDKDHDGKTDSGSVKSEVLIVINSLPVSNSVKDAIYIKNGWTEKKLNETPWHRK